MEGDLKPYMRTCPAIIKGNEHLCSKNNCFYCQIKQRIQNGNAEKLLAVLDMKNTYWKNEEITELLVLKSAV